MNEVGIIIIISPILQLIKLRHGKIQGLTRSESAPGLGYAWCSVPGAGGGDGRPGEQRKDMAPDLKEVGEEMNHTHIRY